MSVTVRGPVFDIDERYKRIVIEVREAESTTGAPPARLIGGYAVCPMEKPYTAVSNPESDELLIGHVIEFDVTPLTAADRARFAHDDLLQKGE